MKNRVVWLEIVVLSMVLLLAGCGRETQRKLEQTQQQLKAATNEIVAVRAEIAGVKVQLQTKETEFQATVQRLTEAKADAEQKILALKNESEGVQQDLQRKLDGERARVTGLEQEKANLTNQITQVNQKLSDLEKTHTVTVANLQAIREEYVKLTGEKTVLEAKLHNLKDLKGQIHVVKQELHVKKVKESQRLDRASSAMGNHGYLVKEGSWVKARTPGKYPLNQEIHLAE